MKVAKKEIYNHLRQMYYSLDENNHQFTPIWDWMFTVSRVNGDTLFTCEYDDDSCYTEYRVDGYKVLVSDLKWIARCFGDHIKEMEEKYR